MGRDVTAPATVTSVLAATKGLLRRGGYPQLPVPRLPFTLPDVIADNASAGRARPPGPPARDLVALRLVGCALRAGGPWRSRRRGRSRGHPAAAVAWLADCLGPRGERLRAGGLVLSGGLTAPVPLEPGQAVTAELDGLGSVEVYSR